MFHTKIIVKKFILHLALVSILLASLFLIISKLDFSDLNASGGNIDWPQYQFDPQNSGRTTVQVNPNYSLKWARMNETTVVTNFVNGAGNSVTDGLSNFQANVIYSNQVQPIVAGGSVYIGALNGKFYKFNGINGNIEWTFNAGAPIMSTALYHNGIVVVATISGKVYGIDALDSSELWSFTADSGISAHMKGLGGNLYFGSRGGVFYSLDTVDGSVNWTYENRIPGEVGSFHEKSSIYAPAVISTDGTKVFFVAENKYLYGLNSSTGVELWTPVQMFGQSTVYSVPVIYNERVMIMTTSSLKGAEESSTGIEQVFYTLRDKRITPTPTPPSLAAETTAIRDYFNGIPSAATNNERQQVFHVYDINTGLFPFTDRVPMGRVTGNNFAPFPPVITPNGPLMYWRSSYATLFGDVSSFGTLYCPDLSYLDMTNGERIPILSSYSAGLRICPELDNGYFLTMGGNRLYMQNGFRGVLSINLTSTGVNTVNGAHTRISTTFAYFDGGNNRGLNYQIIYYGNDSQQNVDIRPKKIYETSSSFGAGIVIASVNGTNLLFVNEMGTGAGFNAGIVAIQGN